MGGKQNLHADGLGQHPLAALAILGNKVFDPAIKTRPIRRSIQLELPVAVFMIAAKGQGKLAHVHPVLTHGPRLFD
jgi:hypothetical protein